jgi:hypothetical protein
MNSKALTALHWGRAGLIIVIVSLGCFLCVSQAEAVLTAQSISGTVEVLLAGEQNWKPLTATMKLQTGDQIKTGPNSSVDLWFEDGSVLNLAEGSQLSINQLEVSTVQKSRVARFKLWWGAVTAKVTKLAFTENVCEVETETVVAGVKFSEMTVIQPQNTSQSEVIAQQGLIEIRQVGEGTVNVSAFLSPKGIKFSLNRVGARVLIGVEKILQKISVECNFPININVVFEGATTLMKLDNMSMAPIQVQAEDAIVELGGGGMASFGYFAGQGVGLSNVEKFDMFLKPWTGAILCHEYYFFLEGGTATANGQALPVGQPQCIPLKPMKRMIPGEGKARELLMQKAGEPVTGEQPTESPDVDSGTPRGADPPSEPTVEPTVEPSEDVDQPGEETDEQDEREMEQERQPPQEEEEEEEEEEEPPQQGGGRPASPC